MFWFSSFEKDPIVITIGGTVRLAQPFDSPFITYSLSHGLLWYNDERWERSSAEKWIVIYNQRVNNSKEWTTGSLGVFQFKFQRWISFKNFKILNFAGNTSTQHQEGGGEKKEKDEEAPGFEAAIFSVLVFPRHHDMSLFASQRACFRCNK